MLACCGDQRCSAPGRRWIGKRNREDLTVPVADFRHMARQTGLIRKNKNRIILTPAGRILRGDASGLWDHLARKILPAAGTIGHDVAMLGLIHTLAGLRRNLDLMADQLTAMGWHTGHNQPLQTENLWVLTGPVDAILDNMVPYDPAGLRHNPIMPICARVFARDSLTADRHNNSTVTRTK